MSAPANDNQSDLERGRAPFKGAPCPICKAPSTADFRPFCSRHCADLDLSRWLNGVYALPVRAEDALEDAELDAMIEAISADLPE